MHIGNRIFPYPVLNCNDALSDYIPDAVFKVEFDVNEDGSPYVQNGDVIFKNLRYTLTDATLLSLVEQGKLKGAFIVECSASVYRSRFDISSVPYDLRISSHEINGNVVVSCYLYATQDIVDFRSTGFIPEYMGYSFDIDKFDILAVDDGYKFKIELDPSEDDKVSSIFLVVKKEEISDLATCDYNENKIIYLPATFYDDYDNIKTKKECNNIAFAILAIPALAWALEDISERDYENLDDIKESLSWFNSICSGYKRVTGIELTYDEFQNRNKFELAQILLNSATCNSLRDLDNLLLGGMNNADEESEE